MSVELMICYVTALVNANSTNLNAQHFDRRKVPTNMETSGKTFKAQGTDWLSREDHKQRGQRQKCGYAINEGASAISDVLKF